MTRILYAAVVAFLASAVCPTGSNADPVALKQDIEATRPILCCNREDVSPDGRWSLFTTERRNLDDDVFEYSLYLIDLHAVRSGQAEPGVPPITRMLARFRTDDVDPHGLIKPTWSADSSKIALIAETQKTDNIAQVFTVTVQGAVEQITHADESVTEFSASPDLSTVVAVLRSPFPRQSENRPLWTSSDRRTAFVIDGASQLDIERGRLETIAQRAPTPRYIIVRGGREVETSFGIAGEYLMVSATPPPSISPDGRWGVLVVSPEADEPWGAYEADLRGTSSEDRTQAKLVLVDLNNLSRRPLLESPFLRNDGGLGVQSWISWSNDSQSLLLSPSYPTTGGGMRPQLRNVVEVTVSSGRSTAVDDRDFAHIPVSERAQSVRWITDNQVEVISQSGSTERFDRSRSGWRGQGILGTQGTSQNVIELSVNAEEEIEARSPTLGTMVLTDLNATEVRSVERGGERVEWNDDQGNTYNGWLFGPVDRDRTKPYPTVIMPAGMIPSVSRFESTASYPIAELSRRNILSLVTSCVPAPYAGQNQFEMATTCTDAAVDQLSRRGLIDPAKVGLGGFSFAGAWVTIALVRGRHEYAAASVVDAHQASPSNFTIVYDGSDASVQQFQRLARDSTGNYFEGAPFGPELEEWLEYSPYFSLDRIRAPIRFELHGHSGLTPAMDFAAVLKRMRRPVEVVYIDEVGHQVLLPSQAIRAQLSIADWFDFWLNDTERTEIVPAAGETEARLAEQYKRWGEYRAQRDAVRRLPRPPLRDWSWTSRPE